MNRIFIFTILLSSFSCSVMKEKRMLKNAVNHGVPKTSKWVGGKDGGEWVNFIFSDDNIFYIDTYNDFTFRLNKRFTYKRICSTVKEEEIKQTFRFTNGVEVFWDTISETYRCIKLME